MNSLSIMEKRYNINKKIKYQIVKYMDFKLTPSQLNYFNFLEGMTKIRYE